MKRVARAEQPLVSVVLPTYNRAVTLERAVQSVLSQSYANLELLVVDDGSKDNTAEVMQTITDPRVRYLPMDRNRGASAARNHGLKAARGKYVAFQDSDDEWLAGKLHQQVDAAIAAGDQDVLIFHMKVVYGRDEARTYGLGRVCCVPRFEAVGPGGERDYVSLMHRENLMSPQTLLFSRDLLAKAGYFDPLLVNSVDWDFAIRLIQHARVIFIEEPLVMTYIQNDSISIQGRNMARSRLRIALKLSRLKGVDPQTLSVHFGQVGMTLARMGKPRMAHRLLRRSVKLAPGKPKNWGRLVANLWPAATYRRPAA